MEHFALQTYSILRPYRRDIGGSIHANVQYHRRDLALRPEQSMADWHITCLRFFQVSEEDQCSNPSDSRRLFGDGGVAQVPI